MEDLSAIFSKKQNINETFTKQLKQSDCSLLDTNSTKKNPEGNN